MLDIIKEILKSEGIESAGMLPVDECEIINPRIMPDFAVSAVMFTIPYRTFKKPAADGFSEYARMYDYHKFAAGLYERIIPRIEAAAGIRACGFCDHSPINEKTAAAKCGLGVIGRNSLFIDKTYGSFVFLGSILTSAECKYAAVPVEYCLNCGRCANICPGHAIGEHGIDPAKCLSAISQSKHQTAEERELLRRNGVIWGCDICQLVCPYNEKAPLSKIEYFKTTRRDRIDKDFIDSLSDGEFKKYAFSYRGRKLVLENIQNAAQDNKNSLD